MIIMHTLLGSGLVSLIMVTAAAAAETHEEWDYDKNSNSKTGPLNWGNLGYPSCSGKSQSPIDIDTTNVKQDVQLQGFQFENYNIYENLILTIINNGHSAQLTPRGVSMKLTGGGLSNTYFLWQFHFHWAGTNEKGSEHTMNGSHYALELHLVHYNSKFADGFAAVNSKEKDALAVLGFFFEISTVNNTAYNELVKDLELIKSNYDHNAAATIDIFHLFNYGIGPYYRYYGSLTTPGCNEVVVWSVFEKTLKISQYQLNAFRKLLNKKNEMLDDNFRPTQPLHGRTITYYNSEVSQAHTQNTNKANLLVIVISACFVVKNL